MSVDILLFRFVERIANISRSVLIDLPSTRSRIPIYDVASVVLVVYARMGKIVTSPTRNTLDLIAVSAETNPETRREPLTKVKFEVGGEAVNETHLLVVVTEIHLSTSTDTDEPVSTKSIRFDSVLVCVSDFHRIDGVSHLLCAQCWSHSKASNRCN